MMFATLPAVSNRPFVSTWKSSTMTSSARKMPICRSRLPRKSTLSRRTERSLGTVGLLLGDDMVGFLLLRHVLHEDLGRGVADGHLTGDVPLREGVDAVADPQQ